MSALDTAMPTFCVDRLPILISYWWDERAGSPQAEQRPREALTHRPAARSRAMGAFFRPTQLEDAGLTADYLPGLVRRGEIEHVARGLYRIADAKPTEYYSLAMVCARIPNSIACLLSALRVHGIGTQAPAEVWIAISHKARMPRFPDLRLRVVH